MEALPRTPGARPYHLPGFAEFPRGRHDDQVDSTAQALARTKLRLAEPGMLGHWRRSAEQG
jgi:hypothetical protein